MWPKNQNWMQKQQSSAAGSIKGWTPEDGRMRPKHVVKERKWTNRKQRCILTDIRKDKQLFSDCNTILKYNIVAYSPNVGAVKVQKPRGMWLRNSSRALLSRALPPLRSRFPPHRALLGYAVNTGSRNSEGSCDHRNDTHNNTQHCVLPHVRLQHL
jgi:hypothetical protein